MNTGLLLLPGMDGTGRLFGPFVAGKGMGENRHSRQRVDGSGRRGLSITQAYEFPEGRIPTCPEIGLAKERNRAG